jgi:hypothetical protein
MRQASKENCASDVVFLNGKGVRSNDTEKLLDVFFVLMEIVQGEERSLFVIIEGLDLLGYMFL